MKKAMRKELLREIRNSRSRFISIFIMVALSTLFLTGLRSASPDMQATADGFFDDTQFMDLRVTSTLGLTVEDVEALSQVDGVVVAAGDWSLDALATDGENSHTVKIHSITPEGVNAPVVLEGTLPSAAGECAIEENLVESLGLQVGDTLYLEDTDTIEDALTTRELTVTAIVESPLYISIERGTGSLGDGSISAYVLVSQETITLDYYTDVYLVAEGAAELDTFSDSYEALIDDLEDTVTPVAEELTEARRLSLLADAQEEIDEAKQEVADGWQEYEDEKQEAIDTLNDGQEELDDARAEGEQEIADAEQELAEAREELDQGWADLEEGRETYAAEIADAEQELAEAQAELTSGEAELADSLTTLRQGEAELAQQQSEAQAQLDEARATLESADEEITAQEAQLEQAKAQLAELQAQIEDLTAAAAGTDAQEADKAAADAQDAAAQTAAEEQLALLQAQAEALTAAIAAGEPALEEAKAQTEAGWTAYYEQEAAAQEAISAARYTLDAGWTAYYEAQTTLASGQAEYEEGVAELEQAKIDGQTELDDAEAELDQGEQDYADGLEELEEARQTLEQELADAQQELDDGWAEAEEKFADAEAELADAEQEIADAEAELETLDEATVYVLDRDYNAGFVSYEQDSERIAALANVFPLLFFIVAALVCLTTMTRMVDEERTQIGAIQALGYGTAAVAAKYLAYGALASVAGTVVGAIIGTKLIPYIICNAYGVMYALPSAKLPFYWTVCLGSLAASLACTLGATAWAAWATMKETPAALMRPRSPKAGKRIFLERIPFIWKHLNFSMKVSARNLFRYKKRFWMTVIGVGGCTALLITGLGLHSGIFAILDRQYDELSLYDLQVSVDTEADADAAQTVLDALQEDSRVELVMESYTNTMSFESDTRSVDGYLVSVADQSEMEGMIILREMGSKEEITMPDNGVVMSNKLSEMLGVSVGDTIIIDGNDKRVEVRVAAICEHYVRHYIYMLDSYYESVFGEAPEDNAVYACIVDDTEEGISEVAADMMTLDEVTSVTNVRTAADNFSETLDSVNVVVVVIILAAAVLAFVVLYNLTNINITERVRELATIKVLGFNDTEVAMYVYRENIVLTLLGIALGQPLGMLLYTYLIRTVEVDMVMFGRDVVWSSYVGAIVLSILFAFLVNFVMYFRLRRIDMVESLKSVE